jgi:hypothetical protein
LLRGHTHMIPAQAAISRFRRDLILSALVRGLMGAAAAAALLAGPLMDWRFEGGILLIGIIVLWFVLSFRSMRGTRLATDSTALIATGQFEQAEAQLDSALRSFSLFRTAKLLGLHHLAVLRHAQRRWQDSALLCQTVLRQRLGNLQGLSRSSLLLMADDLLNLGDLPGTWEALRRLYEHRLTLSEALNLQLLQLDYLSRIGAWDEMLAGTRVKVQMSELMNSNGAARSQALLALAAHKRGRAELSNWLRRRAELLVNPDALIADRPLLRELFGVIA